ncbi:MAG TPA: alkaline phosphatase family protein [Gemmataceae bacterium]|nr:alkaline phosphatase family protein [Gemmataceae bacterium]
MHRRSLPSTLCAVLLLVITGCRRPAPEAPQQPVKLAVLVVFDQMRGDYLTRWDDLFGDDGFHRLEKGGAWFQNCRYPYADTVTGAGHASLATGCSPWIHGIFNNDWYDRDDGGLSVYCAAMPKYKRVPPAPPPEPGAKAKPDQGGTPERLMVPTLADVVKESTHGQGKVISLSYKDRGAVFTGGRKPDACYWFDSATGEAVTSTYYRSQVDDWVAAFNAEKPADRYFGKDWTRLRPDLDYEKRSGPDDAPGESLGYNGKSQGRTFPHPMTGGLTAPGKAYYEALYASPFGNELLLDLVKRAVGAEKLGTDDTPDLLCVSFSCNDPIGHAWGPDSQEVLDVTLRSDPIVKGLLEELDAQVGKGRYLLVLTADHGVCPLPEASRIKGIDAQRILPSKLRAGAEEFLQKTFGQLGDKGTAIEAMIDADIYLNESWMELHKLDQPNVQAALAKWLTEQPGIQAAYTRTQLQKDPPADDELGWRVKRSFSKWRSGDVMIVVKPYCLLSAQLDGTTHGTPHPYDTLVPLIVYGPGVRAGVRGEAVTPLAAVPILAHALGVKPPPDAEADVPAQLFENP